MLVIKCIMRDGVRAFYECDTIDAGRYEPDNSMHLVFRGLIRKDHKGVERNVVGSDIVPEKDIVSVTLYGATQNLDGTMTTTTAELRDKLCMLYCHTMLDCVIIVGTRQQGEEELKTIL